MIKSIYLVIITALVVVSCKQKSTETADLKNADLPTIDITGNLTLDSKGNVFLDFEDTVYNGKIKLIAENYESIYSNYDAFLSVKNTDDSACEVSVSGHYVLPIDTINWVHNRRDFQLHQMSFKF